MKHRSSSPNNFRLALSLALVLIAGISFVTSAKAALSFSAVSAYLQVADAGQEPHYLTFKSLGECHQFVKDNPELGLDKNDCTRGSPPDQPPAEG